MELEEISSGQRLSGVIPGDSVTVIATQWHGRDAVELTFRPTVGHLDQRILYRADEPRLEIARSAGRPFDAPASDFKLAAEAQRIRLAGLFDPMLAVATSDVQPLPHQITAVYGELLSPGFRSWWAFEGVCGGIGACQGVSGVRKPSKTVGTRIGLFRLT